MGALRTLHLNARNKKEMLVRELEKVNRELITIDGAYAELSNLKKEEEKNGVDESRTTAG